nr:uncharacterized protein LOC112008838 [Quercus suber]
MIPANHNPFSQEEVNFVEIMFYNELELDDESPMSLTPRALILEEEEGWGICDLRNLLDRKRKVPDHQIGEMLGLDPGLVVHSLNVDPGIKPVVQPAKVFHTNVEAQITQEVKKLLATGFIKPIQHSKWLSNIIPVKKKNGQIWCCVDFCNLNKACPKDEFPLPNVDLLADSVA